MTSKRFWSESEVDLLRTSYADKPTAALAKQLGRTERQVYAKAYGLGLSKSVEYLSGPHSGRLSAGDSRCTGSRFKSGQKPWNSGLKGWQSGGRSKETQFKKGIRSGRAAELWQPVGSERVTKEGYRQRKVSDTGNTCADYVEVHRLLWEEHNGPIPEGHIVVFRNGDRTDIRIENLELITRAENARRNTIHRYPRELKQAIRLAAKLRRTIEKAE